MTSDVLQTRQSLEVSIRFDVQMRAFNNLKGVPSSDVQACPTTIQGHTGAHPCIEEELKKGSAEKQMSCVYFQDKSLLILYVHILIIILDGVMVSGDNIGRVFM